ncbi:beta strand repeat-containing protein [Rhizobium sp. 2YAF20]|uniref:beta strand repeat-containing protein n=1 Tax=Rhizobium sp. 2YAF20 TaxID=3233027 RepID=UPI003F98EE93
MNATATDIDVASLLASGNIDATAANDIAANAVAHGDLTMTAGNAITLSGQSLGAQNVNLAARSVTIDSLVSGVDYAATSASPTASLMLQPAGAMTLAASSGSISANVLLSGGDLLATATQNIGYASLQSLGNATLTAPGRIDYTSTTRVGGALTINTGALDLSGTRGNGIAAGGALVVNASSANLSGSDLVLGGLTLNLSGNADFTNASVNAVTNAGGSGDIAVSAASLTASDSTALLAAHDLSLTLPSLINAAQLASGHDLTLNIAGNFTNSPTGLIFAGNNANVFLGGVLTNNQGAILAGRDLSIRGAGAGQHNAAVFNSAGLIQSGGNMSIYTDTLINAATSAPQIVRNVAVSDTLLHAYDLISETYGCETRCSGEGDHEATYGWTESVDQLVHQIVLQDQLAAGAGADAKIRSGGNLVVDAVNITNSYSSIESDGNMSLAFNGTLTNEGATLNQTTETVCGSATNCQYYADVVSTEPGQQNCSGPNRGCIDGDPTITYSPNPNGQRDPSRDLQAGTSVTVAAIGVLSGAIQARGALSLDGKGTGSVNNAASAGSLAGQVAINAVTAQSNPLSALNGLTAGGALFSVNSSLAGVAANAGATAGSGPAIGGNSLLGRLGVAIGSSGNLAQILQTGGAQLAALAKPQSGGVGGTVPGQVFLFETRAAYLDVSKFYGSAYFIDRIGYTPETSVPFLGDAYFENQLVDEQLHQQVGQGLGAGSFISGDNAIDQMKTLLDNGVGYAEAHGLALGQALTPEQVASLTQSMVIYQTTTVDGAEVLVPVVYLSAADRANIAASAATISGQTVSMNVGNLDNSGAIAAAGDMTISATNIKTNGGAFLSGGNMNLDASNGIVLAAQTMNIGGQTLVNTNGGVKAGGTLNLDGGAGALTLAATKVTAGSGATLSGQTVTLGAATESNGGKQSLIGSSVAAGGGLSISGADGVNIIASAASSGGNMSVTSTNGAINIVSAAAGAITASGNAGNTTVSADRKGTTTTTTSLTQQGSSLNAGGSMLVSGDQGVLIAGSSLDAGGNIGIISQNGNVAIAAVANETSSNSKTTASAANGYKSGNSSSASLTNTGSSITSNNGGVTVEADNGSIGVIGSSIDANGGAASLIAKNDITIGEATDSASSSSQSGSKKTSETVTIAKGSEISGQTGVNVISKDGDITVSASQIAAGDADHTANANLSAANGNIIVASGKDTDETTSDSKQSGFLSSSKTHTHSYDEATVGSSISATGDINSNAGGANVLSGSSLHAEDTVNMSGSTVTVMGAEETHENDKETKKSGIGVGSGGGFISIYGSHDKTTSDSSTDNVGSSITAYNGNINLNATKGDLNVIGSAITATNGNVTGIAAGNINILPGHESSDSSKDDKRSGFGLQVSAGSSGASIGIGAGRFTDKTTESAETNAVSTIGAGGNITLAAGNTFNDQAGQIAAGGAVTILGTNGVNILSGNDVTNFDEVATNFFAGVSLGVSSSMVGAGQSIENLASKLGNVTDGYSAANVGFAGLKAYDALSSLKDGLAAGNLASISLTAGFTYSKTETELSSSTPVLPTISGNSVSIISTNGDFTSRGLQVSATADAAHAADPMNGDVLISANTIDMAGAEATNTASSSSQSAGASIGVSVGVGLGGATGITPTASMSAGQSKSSSASTTQVMSTVSASNNITFASKGDTSLNNTVFAADTIDGTVGGNLDIVSTPSTGTSANSSQSLGFSFTGGTIGRSADGSPLLTAANAGTALGGLTLGGVQPGFGSGKGSTNWIDTPAGLYSDGATNIYVRGNTNLAAAGIISSTGQVNLDTGTLTWSDFAGSKEYKAYEVDANIDLYSGKDANGQSKNTSSVEGKYQLDDERQSVKATVNGNITVRNGDQQAALEQSGATKPADQINKDPSQQSVITRDKHIDLEPYVSVQSLQAAVAAGKTLAQVLNDAFDKMLADDKLSPEDEQAVKKTLLYVNDPKVKAVLSAGCGVQHTENDYHLLDWLITPAYAEAGVCLMPIPDGTTVRLSPEAVAALRQAVALSIPVLLAAGVFYFGSTVSLGDQIDQTQTLADGTVMHLTGVGDELKRRAEITLPNGQTVSLVLTLNDNGYALVSGSFAGASMSGDTLDDLAKQLTSASGLQVVYNQKSGSGSNGSTTGGSSAAAGSPDPDDNGGNQDDEEASVYRGGDKLTVRNIDVKVDKATGLVQPGRGVSVNTDPAGLEKFGGAHKIELSSIPDELELIQRGNSATHFEIAPKAPMTMENFQALLNQIRLTPQ